jgi:hypothetical protein
VAVAVQTLLRPLAVQAVEEILVLHLLALEAPARLIWVAVAAEVREAEQVVMAVKAAQASSLFHTQAQHNYLVVELLPNQAVTSFTHSHLLAHLALCHL